MKNSLKADIGLLIVTLCWGVSYILIDVCLSEMTNMGLNSLRFLVAFGVAYIAAFKKMQHPSRETLRYAFFVSIALTIVYITATYGVMYTSLSNCGFLNALSTVFTPILGFLVFKKRPEKKIIPVVIICMVGIGLISLDSSFKPALGDIFCLSCAVSYAFHLQITDNAVKNENVNAFQLGVFQLGLVGVYMLILDLVLHKTPSIPQSGKVWAAAIFLAIFCTGLSFIVQAVAQQYTSPNHVGVIFAFEPVFSGIAAYFIAGEVLLPRAYVGAVLMIGSLFVMEIDFGKKKGKEG